MNLTPEEWKLIAAALAAGLAVWAWVIGANRAAEREFRAMIERGDES